MLGHNSNDLYKRFIIIKFDYVILEMGNQEKQRI